MPKHAHDWQAAERLLDDSGPVMLERCTCGEKRTRPMTKDEASNFEVWRGEMARLDVEGEAVVQDA